MGIFGSKAAAGASGAPNRGAALAGGGLSIIGAGMTVRGDIETSGVLKVEGTVDGHVQAKHQVLVAKGGVVHGDIDAKEAIVGGTVHGAIRAEERVEIQAGATVTGDVTTRRVAVAEGASLNGAIKMGDLGAAPVKEHKPESPKADARAAAQAGHQRPSVPIARVAVPPRVSSSSGDR